MNKNNIFPLLALGACSMYASERPNILFVISDDQGWPHAGAYGFEWVNTPAFDGLAEDGVLFNNAFVSAPSSAPSRFSILTGRHFYQNQEGGLHGGYMPSKYPVFTDILRESGYHVGYTGKGCGPFFTNKEHGYTHDVMGKKYNKIKMKEKVPVHSFGNLDYTANFESFLKDRKDGQPFMFTFSCWEPHRPYFDNSGKENGKEPEDVDLPEFLPDIDVVRNEVNDYGFEIDYYDRHLGNIIQILKDKGLYDNTLIVVTSDNGMPFPNAKMHCYEYGTHVPFLICWKDRIQPAKAVDELISVPEIASLFLQAAGVDVPVSFMETTLPGIVGLDDFESKASNDYVVFGKEKHNAARENNMGYPIRSIRTEDYLLVKNYESDRWPAGDPPYYKDLNWGTHETSMMYELNHQTDEEVAPYFKLHTQKRPEIELYNIKKDPYCLNNLASKKRYSRKVNEMLRTLEDRLKKDGDPRISGDGECFDSAPSSFTNPGDYETNKPIFKEFPKKGKSVKGMRTFDHSNDSIEADGLRIPRLYTEIKSRDPFILADEKTKTYYMYCNGNKMHPEDTLKHIRLYTSKNLVHWKDNGPCFVASDSFWGKNDYWAPDVYKYKGKYYMFVTFSDKPKIRRGTSVLVSKTPEGPFVPLVNAPITPTDMEALDGSLYLDDDKQPWMLFCQEWTQIKDGLILAQKLSKDLKTTIGKPVALFHGSEAIGLKKKGGNHITDAPFIHLAENGDMLMTWSTFGKSGYMICVAKSESGDILGPWKQIIGPLYKDNGGHAMLFKDFDGNLRISYHSPNSKMEKMIIKIVSDAGGMISSVK